MALGCAGAQGSKEPATLLMTADVAPLGVDLRAVALTPGLRWVEVPSASREARRMLLLVPNDVQSRGPRPLLVFLHGAGGGSKLPDRMACLIAPAFEKIAPIIVAPQGHAGEWWNEEETAYVLGLVDAAVRDWRVDAKRTVVMGYSNGGIGAWFFARLYPERFSAAIPMASNHAIIGESPLPIRVIHGSNDALFDVTRVRAGVEALARQGLDVSLVVKEGGKHEAPCTYVPELSAAAAWLESHAWKKLPSP
jgi:predicted peptidase